MTHTLLLITDDPVQLTALTELYARQTLSGDYLAVAALEEGVACLAARPFTHILADINQLPPDNPALWAPLVQLPLIVLARPGQETAVARALEAGAASYLIADAQNQSLTLLPALIRQTAVTCKDSPQDITENQRLVEALAVSARHMRAVLTALPDLVFRIHRDGTFLDYYASDSDDLAFPPEQFLGKNMREIMPPDLVDKVMQVVTETEATGKDTAFEYDLFVHDQQRSYEACLVPFDAGEYLAVVRNITSRRRGQAALRQSEEKYRTLVESYDSAITMFNPDGQLLYINNIGAQDLGGTPDTLVGKGLFEFLPPEIAEPRLQRVRQVAQMGEGLVLEESVVTQAGTVWYRTSIQPVRDAAGQVASVLVNAVNITPIKQAEATLRSREAMLSGLLDSQTNYALRVDLAGKYTYWNKKFADDFAPAYGGEAGLMQGDALLSTCDYHHERARQTVEKCLTQPGVVFQVELDKPTGNGRIAATLWEFICLTDNDDQPWEVQCVGINISALKKAETALRESERRYRQMFEQHSLPKLIIDLESNAIVAANPAAIQFYGYSLDELVAMSLDDLSQTPQEELRVAVAQAAAGDLSVIKLQQRHADGSVRDVELFSGLLDMNGQPRLYALVSDITERRRAQRALKEARDLLERRVLERTAALAESELRYRSLFNQSSDAVVIVDVRGKPIQANQRASDLLGYTREEMSELSIEDVAVSDELAESGQIFARLLAGEKIPIYKRTLRHRDGRLIPTEINAELVRDEKGAPLHVQSIIRDISAREGQERRLRFHASLQQAVTDAVMSLDNEHRIQSWNAAAERLYGFTEAEALGKDEADLLPKEYLGSFTTLAARAYIRENEFAVGEMRVQRKDGRWLWVFVSVSQIKDGNGRVEGFVFISRDITASKEAEIALRLSEQRYRNVVDTQTDPIIRYTPDFVLTFVNDAYCRYFGKTQEELIGRSFFELIPPDEHDATRAHCQKLLANPRAIAYEHNVIDANGKQCWLALIDTVIVDDLGQPQEIQSVGRDITERKEMEEALRQSEERLDLATRAVDIGVWEWEISSDTLHWDKRMYDQYGLPAEQAKLSYKTWANALHPDDADKASDLLRAVLQGQTTSVEFRMVRPNGDIRYMLSLPALRKDEKGQPARLAGINLDITASKEVEIALRLSEQRYRNVVDTQTDLIVRYTPDLVLSFVNDAYCRYFGKTQEEMIGLNFLELIPLDEREATRAHCQGLLANPRVVAYEHRVIDAAGKQRWQAWVNSVIVDDLGQPQKIQAVGRDITERKEMEDALRQSEERLELAARAGGIGVWDWDIANNTLHWDEWMYTLYGLPAHQTNLNYHTWANALHPDDVDKAISLMEVALQEEKSYETEFRIIKPNGEIRHIMSLAYLVHNETGSLVRMVGINMDISARKETERALRAALEKERELSELKTRFVSIASHEFRTPLAAILAATETLSIYRGRIDETQINARLDKIRQQVNRMKALIENLLQLDRVQTGRMEFRPADHNLSELCRQIIHEFNSQTAYHDRVVCACDSLPALILFDKQLMRQAVSNLISNGLKYSSPDTSVTVNAWVDNTQIYLTVQDRGIGIPPESLPQLFDPFYRADNVGAISGTGLGLPIARQAVEMHGGALSVESEPGVGTTFTISMPLRQPGSYEDDQDFSY